MGHQEHLVNMFSLELRARRKNNVLPSITAILIMCLEFNSNLWCPFPGFSRYKVLWNDLPFPSSRTVEVAQGQPGWLLFYKE